MSALADWLANNPIFSCFSEKEREKISAAAVPRKCAAGERLTFYGDIWPYLFLVTSGTIQVTKESSEGRSLIVLVLESGDLFWGLGFFEDGAGMPGMLEAQNDSQVYLWSREQLMPWLLANGRFSWELSRLAVSRMQRASVIVEELAFKPVAGRLAGLLLDYYQDAIGEPVARSLTLDQMAAHIGTTREMVCRLLYRFSDQNLIHITRTEFVLHDEIGLMKLTGDKTEDLPKSGRKKFKT